jgi:hypothetical protein
MNILSYEYRMNSHRMRYWLTLLLLFLVSAGKVHGATPREEVEQAKAAIELRIAQATADALVAQRAAETRQAIAEAERAELLARLPPSSARPLSGSMDTSQFGAAGLVKAIDIAVTMARDLCGKLPADRPVAIYEAVSMQGMVAARTMSDGILHLTEQLTRQNQELQRIIEQHAPPGVAGQALGALTLAVVPATVKTAADVAALFKTDLAASGTAFGDGARTMFATALAQACPGKLAGLGAGYLGEMDDTQHMQLLEKVRTLAGLRGAYAAQLGTLGHLADAAKGEQKRTLAALETAGVGLLKTIDGFIDSLKAGDTSDKGPLMNAARYLAYARRTHDALILDFNLRLEGMSIVKDNWFTGQQLRLSGVAFLWYRLHEPDGRLRMAEVMRTISAPLDVDLRARVAQGAFWRQGAMETP